MQKHIKYIINVLIAIIFFGGGIFISPYLKNNQELDIEGCKQYYSKGWSDAKSRLSKLGLISDSTGDKMVDNKSVNGVIKRIDKDLLTVEITPMEILADPDLDTRFIKVTDGTKIIIYKNKPEDQYRKEVEEFYKDYRGDIGPDAPLGLPLNFEKVKGTISMLKDGQKIDVKSNENILNQKSFEAVEIVAVD